mmetsp:Transcript_20953/g.53573  ORF Transcript_20953/g.53573 Transcript_20953/m.53573 type:complete len:219 (+) Transcript_20953:525-1181(+)
MRLDLEAPCGSIPSICMGGGAFTHSTRRRARARPPWSAAREVHRVRCVGRTARAGRRAACAATSSPPAHSTMRAVRVHPHATSCRATTATTGGGCPGWRKVASTRVTLHRCCPRSLPPPLPQQSAASRPTARRGRQRLPCSPIGCCAWRLRRVGPPWAAAAPCSAWLRRPPPRRPPPRSRRRGPPRRRHCSCLSQACAWPLAGAAAHHLRRPPEKSCA